MTAAIETIVQPARGVGEDRADDLGRALEEVSLDGTQSVRHGGCRI